MKNWDLNNVVSKRSVALQVLMAILLLIAFASLFFSSKSHAEAVNSCQGYSQKTILINLANQSWMACENNQLAISIQRNSGKIISGRATMPTRQGSFEVFSKGKAVYFKCDENQPAKWIINAKNYCYRSEFWMAFTQDSQGAWQGLHDSNWWSAEQ